VLYTVHFTAFCLGGGGFRTRCSYCHHWSGRGI